MTERKTDFRPPMKVDLTVGAIGHTGKVCLDGVDISRHVSAVTFRASVNDFTTVELTLVNVELTIDGEAIVSGVVVPVLALDGRAEDVTAVGDEHRHYRARRDVA